MEHRFYTLDVFTNNRFEGNPLAVFTDGDGLSDDQMLAIAREMNLSETVFVQKPTEEEALARLRIFTTKEELKLAGHPVIGTWFLLAELGVVPAQDGGVHVLQETGAGILPVEIRFKDGRPQRVTMTQKEAIFKPAKFNKKKLASALGISPKDFDPKLQPEFVSTGIFNLMVPLRNRAALGNIAMNMTELRRLQGKNATMAYCFALGGNGKAFSRGMLPWELYEDAATGSAAVHWARTLCETEISARPHLEHSSGRGNGTPKPDRSGSHAEWKETRPARQRRGRESFRRHHPRLTSFTK